MLAAGVAIVVAAIAGLGSSSAPSQLPTPRTFAKAIQPTPRPDPTGAPPAPPTPVPSDARIERLLIPKIKVDAPVETLFLQRDGSLQDPKGGTQVGWYDFCGETAPVIWRGCSLQPEVRRFSRPGFGGNSVFAGHVYWQDKKSVFIGLSQLVEGDDVQIRLEDGTLYHYQVVALQVYPAEGAPVEQIIGSAGREVVTLITCYGFNPDTQDYDNRVVVVAERAPPPAPSAFAR